MQAKGSPEVAVDASTSIMPSTGIHMVWVEQTNVLEPPFYGSNYGSLRAGTGARWQELARASTLWPTHSQHVLRVNGSASSSFGDYSIRTRVFVSGALWRTSLDALCSAQEPDPEQEVRVKGCDDAGGVFRAAVWLFVPGPLPSLDATSPDLSELRSMSPAEVVDFVNRPCVWARPLMEQSDSDAALVRAIAISCKRLGAATPGTRSPTLHQVFGKPEWSRAAHGVVATDAANVDMRNFWAPKHQIWGDSLLAMATAFVEAARSVPQPFQIVESGNLCGGSTTVLALLKKRFCPACHFVTSDPGWYRVVRGFNLSCPAETLEWAGLRDQVDVLHNGPTAALPIEWPVGFVYLDDGKSRFWNAPVMAYLSDKLMDGAVVAMDDPWQAEPLWKAKGHYGQMVFATELVEHGGFSPFFVPPSEPPLNALGGSVGGDRGGPPEALLRAAVSISRAATLRGRFEPMNTVALKRVRRHVRHVGRVAVKASLVDESAGGKEAGVSAWAELSAVAARSRDRHPSHPDSR